ncbi:MAG: ribose-5-phosphate isomerase RpiA, partial [Blastocatellia bacterium]
HAAPDTQAGVTQRSKMTSDDATRDAQKQEAGERAAEFVQDGNLVGLGTGSTAAFAIRALGRRVLEGLKIRGVPTSKASQSLAEQLGIPLVDLNEYCRLDVSIDGADEIDPAFDMIKGGGGALIREKLVALASDREIIIVDELKLVPRLGQSHPVPVEVLTFGWCLAKRALTDMNGNPRLRMTGDVPFVSDNGNYIFDCEFGPIGDPPFLEKEIKQIPGVVDSGLFIGLADTLIVGSENGVLVKEAP